MRNSVKIYFIIFLLVLIFANQYFFTDKKNPEKETSDNVSTQEGATEGEALIGGKFELTDQNGNEFTEKNLKGKYSLVYFGFTHCPMICPTALSSLSLTMDKLGDDAKNFQPVFITTDPERDDTTRMKEFLTNFNSSIIGLTGSAEQISAAQQVYRVYAEKSTAGKDGNYEINHSSIIYVMDKDGKYLDHFSHETPVDEMVKKLNELD